MQQIMTIGLDSAKLVLQVHGVDANGVVFMRRQLKRRYVLRAHLAEFGVTASVGRKGIEELLRVIADPSDMRVERAA